MAPAAWAVPSNFWLQAAAAAAVALVLPAVWWMLATAISHGGAKWVGQPAGKQVPTRKSKRYRLPPGPKPCPVVGNLPALARGGRNAQTDEKLAALARTYGPIMHLTLGSVPTVVISSPELAQVVLKEQDLVFATRPAAPFVVRELSSVEDGTPFAPYGPDWRFTRKLLTLELLTHKRIQHFQPVRREEIDAMVKGIRHSVVTNSGSIDLVQRFRAAAFNTLTRITVGKRYVSQPGESASDHDSPSGRLKTDADPEGKNRDMYRVVIGDTVRLVTTARMLGDFLPKLAFLDNVLRAGLRAEVRSVAASKKLFYDKILEEHRARTKNPEEQHTADVMDMLLNVQDPSGEALKDKKIVAMVRTMIVGGTDTSAMSLTGVMEDLLREPKYLQMAHQELDQVVGHDRKVEESDLPNLPLLRAIIKESWRLSTFGSGMLLPRCATQDTQVAGYDIPANTTVLVNTRAIFRDPAVWPDPHRFFPERFLQRPDIDTKGQHFEFLVFGSGRRSCPGANLGTLMVEIMLARLLHSFTFTAPTEPHQDQDTFAAGRNEKLLGTDGTLMALPSLRLPSHLY